MARKKEYLLRIDDALWREIQAWAADELRSVNSQIEYVLRRAISQHRRDMGPQEASSAGNASGTEPE